MRTEGWNQVGIDGQIEAARREFGMRVRVYTGWVEKGKMSKQKADHELDAMASIVKTLEMVKMLFEQNEEAKAAA